MPKSDGSPSSNTPAAIQLYGALAVGVLSVSSAAVLIRLAHAPASAIAFWRLFLTSLLLLPVLKRPALSVTRQAWPMMALSGIFLAAHFIFWIHSLSLLPVALSTALVSTHPLLVALFRRLQGHHPLPRGTQWGLGLLAAGLATLALGAGPHVSWLGIADALAGSLFAGAYILTGAYARRTLSATTYSWGTYTAASFILALGLWGRQGNFGPMSWHLLLLYGLMAVIPTLGGHTLFNWMLRFVPASHVSLAMVGEIPGAALLAWLVLHQLPTFAMWLSILLITCGIAIALSTERMRP
ncbi:DMT family transporter [Sulfobacillus sp. hq2]|uniref:DMT family transporter n=1 Tax=Sulfobacillus TaxID=28033 RepID=UPI000CD1D266|nr:DMT family transporter [Sulfobacillus sp. hq2]POB11135.1 EamA family transporter [Sulfobacillus sp. hq2]